MRAISTILNVAAAILTIIIPVTAGFVPAVVETLFVEEIRLGAELEAHTPATCVESNNFNLIGGVWSSFPVTYKIDVSGAPSDVQAGAATAIIAGFEGWEGITSVPNFFQNVASSKNTVRFRNIDGPGNVLAQVQLISRQGVFTKFTMTFDNSDNWEIFGPGDTCPTPDGRVGHDIQNVANHEAGHVVGLHHATQGSPNQALTMYPFILDEGEVYKRSPGQGDWTGMQTLY